MKYEKIVILIPAYKPTEELIKLVRKLNEHFPHIVVVDDGSGNEHDDIFTSFSKNITVIRYGENKGKGGALKTGLKYIDKNYKETIGVITCDADGQHKVNDIINIASVLMNSTSLIIGSRKFTGKVPLRSAFGNTITRWVYFLASNLRLADTQTGLRAIPAKLIPLALDISGTRYEYEINMLLEIAKKGISIQEVPIETVYIDNNSSSHFNTIKDSFRIYSNILRFSLLSLISFILEFIFLLVFYSITLKFSFVVHLLISVILAKMVGYILKFFMDRKALSKFYLLPLNIFLDYILLYLLIILGTSLFVAKVITVAILLISAYLKQKYLKK